MPKNQENEQLDYLGNVHIAIDQPLRGNKLLEAVRTWLSPSSCSIETILNRKVFVYKHGDKKIILLLRAITYLGNPHPIFKKRIQIPDWYQDFCRKIEQLNLSYDIRFIGVYHYEENVIFVDFKKDTYISHSLHNSSAHVYTNDLYQAQVYGIFNKEDRNGNYLVCIRNSKLLDYLNGTTTSDTQNLFELFRRFNSGFSFGYWLSALDTIREMYENEWKQWRQAEWAGWFLEYKFNKFTIDAKTEHQMRYVSQKKEGELDFDIRFEESDFYGDLKASDLNHSDAPGNDQENLVECIYRYGRFWYIIYEHETKKDKDCGYIATTGRNQFIRSIDPAYEKNDMSYSSKMKNSVRFLKMTIIELNKVNYRDALKQFNQGHQPNGEKRKPKFLINKAILNNDNYAVFRYTYK